MTRCIALLVAFVAFLACARIPPSDPAERIAAALWLPEDAVILHDAARPVRVEHGRSIYVDGSGAVAFRVRRECSQFAADVTGRFDPRWTRRDRQFAES